MQPNKAFKIWCEFDMGQEYVVFSTKKRAKHWMKHNATLKGHQEDYPEETIEKLMDDGLLGIEELELDPE